MVTGYVSNQNAYTVECPACGAWPNQECVSLRSPSTPLAYSHAARRQAWLDLDAHHYDSSGKWTKVKP